MREKTKTPFISLFIIILLISFSINFVSIPGSCSDTLENPNGEGVWEFRETSISILYHNEKEDIDYILKNGSIAGNTLTTTVVKETEETVTVNLKIELNDYARKVVDIDYDELLFEIDKEDNDATLIEDGHPKEGKRIGFFPFFGFAEEPVYDNTYNYVLGGESEPVRFISNSGINIIDPNAPDKEHRYTIESVYGIKTEPEEKNLEFPKYTDDIFELGSYLDINFKQYQGRLYPFSVSACLPAEILMDEPDDEAYISLGPDFSPEQEDVIEYLQSLPPMEDPHDSNDLGQIVIFVGIPGAVAAFGGYFAYKKKKGD